MHPEGAATHQLPEPNPEPRTIPVTSLGRGGPLQRVESVGLRAKREQQPWDVPLGRCRRQQTVQECRCRRVAAGVACTVRGDCGCGSKQGNGGRLVALSEDRVEAQECIEHLADRLVRPGRCRIDSGRRPCPHRRR